MLEPESAASASAAATPGEAGIADVLAPRPMRADVWRRFRRNKLAMAGLAFILLLVVLAAFAPLIAPYSITDRVHLFRKPPSSQHLFGTDGIGRDVFSRVVYGTRVSLRVGVFATAIALSIGVLVGSLAGFFGKFVDTVLMRFTDMLLSIPYIILAIAVATVVGRGENSVILVLGFTSWLAIARIVRASFLALKPLEYVEAARALGLGRSRIMFRHMLPNALQPIIVYGTIAVGGMILAEAALSFLGVGAVDPTPAWGLMVNQGRVNIVNAPHVILFPGGAIFFTVLAFVFVGDGLRDALDPRLR